MPRYAVSFSTTAYMVVEVEADDRDEALDRAYENLGRGSTTNIHNDFDLGDWEATDGVEELDD